MRKSLPAAILLLCVLSNHLLQAQLTDLPTVYDTLYSNILKEKRPLEIVIPGSYKPDSTDKFDVLYTTDGEYTTKIVSSFAQFLSIQFMPANIVVSIPNSSTGDQRHRERDMLPTHVDGVAESGGAANFLAFIKEELIPYINKKYRVSGVNTLYGSSFAGVFTMYALLKEPQLFQSFLIADPAFWWDNGYMNKLAKETLPTLPVSHTSLLITGREGAPFRFMGVAGMDSILRDKAPAGLHWKTNVYSDETHNSMIFRTVYDGLKFTYAGYSTESLNIYPMNGIVLKDQPLKVVCPAELMKDIHYTTDGTEPTRASSKVDSDRIVLTGPAMLTVRSFSNREGFNKTVSGVFKSGESLAPATKPKNAQPGGFRYSYYEGTWDSLPNFKKLKPVQSGQTDKNFAVNKLPKQKNFACLQEGFLEAKEDGYYFFGLDCSGGAKLSIGKQTLIDYNGLHDGGNFQSYMLPLKKGFYPFRLEYFQKQGDASCQLYYITPGKEDTQPIPAELQYSASK